MAKSCILAILHNAGQNIVKMWNLYVSTTLSKLIHFISEWMDARKREEAARAKRAEAKAKAEAEAKAKADAEAKAEAATDAAEAEETDAAESSATEQQ